MISPGARAIFRKGPSTQYVGTWDLGNKYLRTGFGQVYDGWVLGPLEIAQEKPPVHPMRESSLGERSELKLQCRALGWGFRAQCSTFLVILIRILAKKPY